MCVENWATSVKVRGTVMVSMGLQASVVWICPPGAFAYSSAAFGSGTGSLYYRSFSCSGTESSLLSCSYTTGSCSASLGAAVRCQGNSDVYNFDKFGSLYLILK